MFEKADPLTSLSGGTPLTPDKTVTELENKLVEVTKDAVVEGRFPGRPGYGTQGVPVVLRTNHFHLRFASELGAPDSNRVLYRYEVEILGDVSKMQKRRAIEQLLSMAPFKDHACATDYAKIIVTTTDLKHNRGDKVELSKTLEFSGRDPVTTSALSGATAPGNVREAVKRKSVKYNL
jgi:eukaryotic translation initiation factor 2C